MYTMINVINSSVCYIWNFLGELILNSYHNERKSPFILYLYEMIDVHWTSCGDHFMMYLSQIIMLYTLNLYGAACKLYLIKTQRSSRCGSAETNLTVIMRTQGWSLASLSGLRIQRFCELWCWSQMRLGSRVYVAVA